MPTIAVDAMGGDNAPFAIVEGAIGAARSYGLNLILVGDEKAIAPLVKKVPNIEIRHASQTIEMDDDPGHSIRKKSDASLVVCAKMVAAHEADATVSAGNTGAVAGAALLKFGRISGVPRPAIATTIPVFNRHPSILLDSGANADCLPQWLVSFARMGSEFSKKRFGVKEPRVATLSIGEESSKGNKLVKEASVLLRNAEGIAYIGNIEGRDLLNDSADVIVTDGFTGNVALKTLEGSTKFARDLLRRSFSSSLSAKLAGAIMRNKLKSSFREVHPDRFGGAMLLGVKGISVISHGSASAIAIENSIKLSAEMVDSSILDSLEKLMSNNKA